MLAEPTARQEGAVAAAAGDALAVSHCPDLTCGELQDPHSFGGSLGLNGNKVIFNAAIYRGSLGGFLSPEMNVFRVACGPSPRARLTRQPAMAGMSCPSVAADTLNIWVTYAAAKLGCDLILEHQASGALLTSSSRW